MTDQSPKAVQDRLADALNRNHLHVYAATESAYQQFRALKFVDEKLSDETAALLVLAAEAGSLQSELMDIRMELETWRIDGVLQAND